MSEQHPINTMVAVDYLTVTTKTQERSANLIHELFALRSPSFWHEERSHPWRFMGYIGRAYNGVRYGLRKDEGIAMLSGPMCQALWDKVAPNRDQCTRIDLAVTIELEVPDKSIASVAYQAALDGISQTNSIVTNSHGGQTVYLGSRQSKFFGRIYDKGAEQGTEPGKFWRFELECKKPNSEAIVNRLLEADNVGDFIGEYVARWFEARAIVIPWFRSDIDCAIEMGAVVSSHQKTLEWLRSQVKPALGRLIVAGREKEAFAALGLPVPQNLFEVLQEVIYGTE